MIFNFLFHIFLERYINVFKSAPSQEDLAGRGAFSFLLYELVVEAVASHEGDCRCPLRDYQRPLIHDELTEEVSKHIAVPVPLLVVNVVRIVEALALLTSEPFNDIPVGFRHENLAEDPQGDKRRQVVVRLRVPYQPVQLRSHSRREHARRLVDDALLWHANCHQVNEPVFLMDGLVARNLVAQDGPDDLLRLFALEAGPSFLIPRHEIPRDVSELQQRHDHLLVGESGKSQEERMLIKPLNQPALKRIIPFKELVHHGPLSFP